MNKINRLAFCPPDFWATWETNEGKWARRIMNEIIWLGHLGNGQIPYKNMTVAQTEADRP